MKIEGQLLILLVLLVGRMVSADQPQNVDSGSPAEPVEVLVLLQTPQEEILGPEALSESVWSQLGTWGALFGIEGVLVGASIDGVASFIGRDDKATMDQGIKSIAGTLNFEATLLGAINELDRETDWRIYNVEQGDFAELAGRVANRRFRSIPVNFVLFVSARYYFAPDLNQIVLRSEARIYSRSKIKGRLPATYTRRYEYLSKSKGNILRPFRTGEKEALIADVEARFTALVEQYPANRKAYSKERRHAIRILKKRDVIPPIMALSEGWPGLSFTDELVRATDQLEQMLKVDLHDFPPSRPVKGHFIPFNGLSSSGKPKKLRGHIVDKLGTNTVYRDRYGDMYSVP